MHTLLTAVRRLRAPALRLVLAAAAMSTPTGSTGPTGRLRRDAGQTTAEYALVLLGAAAIAMLIVTWASGSDFVGTLMGWILDKIKGGIGLGGQ